MIENTEKNFDMLSNDELEQEKTRLKDEFNSLKTQCTQLSEKMTELSKDYFKINNILIKRQGRQ